MHNGSVRALPRFACLLGSCPSTEIVLPKQKVFRATKSYLEIPYDRNLIHHNFVPSRICITLVMGEVDFEMSSQAKYYMFDESSLRECRKQACTTKSESVRGKPKVRKFACGYHSRTKSSIATRNNGDNPLTTSLHSNISPDDQETLIHFHAHQIQKLIGPNAIFPILKRGASVLSTAIMLFRKFYLSNSVIDFHPRNIAAASALLAVKTDCERNLPVSQSSPTVVRDHSGDFEFFKIGIHSLSI